MNICTRRKRATVTMRRSPIQTKVSSKVSWTVQVRYLSHVMRQAESSRDTVQWQKKNSCFRDAFVFFLYGTRQDISRSQWSAADVGQELTIFSQLLWKLI